MVTVVIPQHVEFVAVKVAVLQFVAAAVVVGGILCDTWGNSFDNWSARHQYISDGNNAHTPIQRYQVRVRNKSDMILSHLADCVNRHVVYWSLLN